jgi:Domain of unknown function (DUF4160)
MPTVLRSGPYRFFFYASDRGEPAHTTWEREVRKAKFWLNPVRLARNIGFRGPELNQLQSLVEQNQQRLIESWDDYFNDVSLTILFGLS